MRTLLLTVITVLVTTGAVAQAGVWNVVDDFSITNGNPNGDWTYGYWYESQFTPYTLSHELAVGPTTFSGWYADLSANTPDINKNIGDSPVHNVQPGELTFHPGRGGEASIARWTAPLGISGLIEIDGQFLPGDSNYDGDEITVGVFRNLDWETPLWQATDSGTFHLQVSVASLDTIEFAVYGGYSYGNTPLKAIITGPADVPAPSSGVLMMLGVAAIGLVNVARRKWKKA